MVHVFQKIISWLFIEWWTDPGIWLETSSMNMNLLTSTIKCLSHWEAEAFNEPKCEFGDELLKSQLKFVKVGPGLENGSIQKDTWAKAEDSKLPSDSHKYVMTGGCTHIHTHECQNKCFYVP